MKKILYYLVLGILFCQSSSLLAQTNTPTRYTHYAYMKVAPGMEDEYIKMEKAYKKLHAAAKKAGKLEDWSLGRLISPAGTNNEYDYVARNVYVGDEQLANSIEGTFDPNWQSLLTKEEIELVNKTNQIRSMVKTELWSGVDQVLADDVSKSKIVVVNYFTSPEGKTRADHIKMENDIWKPLHAARVKDGGLKGWLLLNLDLPFGASMPYDMMTVDVYADMKGYLKPWFDDYFKKIHPNKDVNQLMQQTSAATKLVKGELRMVVDRLGW